METAIGIVACLILLCFSCYLIFALPAANRANAMEAARAAVKKHFRTLVRLREQLGGTDNYGKHVDRGWVKEATYFLNSEVPERHRKHLKPIDIEHIIVEELNSRPPEPAKEDFQRRFSQVVTGTQFEHFVKNELISLGWDVRHIGGAGDQGADLIASMDLFRVAIQCKLHSKPLNNQCVQEVVAAQKFHDTHAAVVISNQPFNKSAQALAKANDVVQIPHDDLELFDHLFLVEVNRGTNRRAATRAAKSEDRPSSITTSEQLKRQVGEELLDLGWEVQDLGSGSQQGADLIATRDTYRVAIQCTLYSKPLTSLSVQLAAAARDHHQTDDAVIVSNHPLDADAAKVASAQYVFHIPHTYIEAFNDLYLSSGTHRDRPT